MSFASIEGFDGNGKTEQVRLLVERFRKAGQTVLQTKEQDGGRLGAEVRAILSRPDRWLASAEQLLLVSAERFDHVRSVVRPALVNGHRCVPIAECGCERYLAPGRTFTMRLSSNALSGRGPSDRSDTRSPP